MPPRAKTAKAASNAKNPVGRPPTKRAREPASKERPNFAKRLKRKEEEQLSTDKPYTEQVVAQPPAAPSATSAHMGSKRRAAQDAGALDASYYQDLWLAERRNSARLYDEQKILRDAVHDRERFIEMQLSAGVCQTYVDRYGQDDVDEFLRRVRTHVKQYAYEQLSSVPPSHPSYGHREFIASLSTQVDALVRDSFAMRGFHTAESAD